MGVHLLKNCVVKYARHSIVLSLLVLSSGLIVAALAAPTANAFAFPKGETFYGFLAAICHQDYFKSYFLFGHPMGLCARCIGGYLGVACSAVFLFILQLRQPDHLNWLLLYAVGITLFMVGVMEAILSVGASNAFRLISGFVGGCGASLAVSSFLTMLLTRGKKDAM